MTGGAMEAFGLLLALGVRVREVADLDEGALWLPQQRLLLIDADLDDEGREEVADLFLLDAFAASNTSENA